MLIEVSLGEILDKLSILEIKLEKINDDNRVKYVKYEYESLIKIIKSEYIDNYLYKLLKKINICIWDNMDKLRDDDKYLTNEQYNLQCKKCFDSNDIRFRIKNKINNIYKSEIREQKGYKKKKTYIITEDISDNCEIIEYLSVIYDIVIIIYLTDHNNYIKKNIDKELLFLSVNEIDICFDFDNNVIFYDSKINRKSEFSKFKNNKWINISTIDYNF